MPEGSAAGHKGSGKAGMKMTDDIHNPFYEDEKDEKEDFLFHGQGYYDEEGIWHDPEVEEGQE